MLHLVRKGYIKALLISDLGSRILGVTQRLWPDCAGESSHTAESSPGGPMLHLVRKGYIKALLISDRGSRIVDCRSDLRLCRTEHASPPTRLGHRSESRCYI
jgi:hypothetical protein